jgi:hypothetical protein
MSWLAFPALPEITENNLARCDFSCISPKISDLLLSKLTQISSIFIASQSIPKDSLNFMTPQSQEGQFGKAVLGTSPTNSLKDLGNISQIEGVM